MPAAVYLFSAIRTEENGCEGGRPGIEPGKSRPALLSGVLSPVGNCVMFCGFLRVVFSLYMVAMRHMGVVSGPFVFPRFVMFRRNPVVLRGLLVVFRGLAMMLGALL